jgi:hypothetical protein
VSGIRLYIDEDAMDGDLVRALRSREMDIVTAADAGMINRSGQDHLQRASEQLRVLYSFNLGDFYRIHSTWLAGAHFHAGIIRARQQRYSVGDQVRRLMRLTALRTAESMYNRVEFLSHWHSL